jgi:prepilin-type processing-associated H-X9-DG protein
LDRSAGCDARAIRGARVADHLLPPGREHHAIEEPRGQANFAFADGHVEMLNQKQLVQADGRSSYAALWCPIDRDVDAAQAH